MQVNGSGAFLAVMARYTRTIFSKDYLNTEEPLLR